MFHKNFVWTLVLFWFQLYCQFTGQLVFDYLYVLLFNVLLTSTPLIVLGALDQDIASTTALLVPQVYSEGFNFSFSNSCADYLCVF